MKKLLSLSLTGIMLWVSAEAIDASWNGPPMGMRLMPVPPGEGPMPPSPLWAAPMPPGTMWAVPPPRPYYPSIRRRLSDPQTKFRQLRTELETVKSELAKQALQLAEAKHSDQALSVVRDQLQAELEIWRTEVAAQKEVLKEVHDQVAKLTDALQESQQKRIELVAREAGVKDQLDRLTNELGTTRSSLTQCDRRIEALTNERHEIKAQLKRARTEAATAKKGFEQVRNRKADLATFELVKQRNATLEADRTELREEFGRLKGVLHGQKQALETKLTDLTDALTVRDQAALKAQRALETELTEQRQALRSLQDKTADTKAVLSSVTDQLSALTQERKALGNRLRAASGEQQQLAWDLAALKEKLGRSTSEAEKRTAEIEGLQKEKAALDDDIRAQAAQITQLTQDQRTQRDRIDTLQTEKVGLLEQIVAEKVKSTRLEEDSAAQINQLKQEMATLEKRLSAARVRLTPEEGGEADLQAVRARSAALTNAYNAMYTDKTAHVPADPSVLAERNKFSDDLFAEQSLLARLIEARGLYTVRPRDSLSRIAYRVYGAGDRWQDIFKTNQHLLHDPDDLVPGLVLVIP
jgi:chromosome segregation ATPase